MSASEIEEPRRSALEELRDDPASRKRFLRALGGSGAVAAFGALLAACGGSGKEELTPGGSKPNTGAGVGTDLYGPGDRGILAFALTLEYLEADFYEAALQSGELSGRAGEIARRFGAHERQHIAALEQAIGRLGGEPPQRPRGQFPLSNRKEIVDFALGIESLGASAYLAQADRIEDPELLAAALSIHTVEGRHAATLALLAGQEPAPQAFALPTQAADVLAELHRITSGNAT